MAVALEDPSGSVAGRGIVEGLISSSGPMLHAREAIQTFENPLIKAYGWLSILGSLFGSLL